MKIRAIAPIIVAVLIALPLSAPASPQESVESLGPGFEASLNQAIDCVHGKIVDLDDGVSDASVIAKSAMGMCTKEIEIWMAHGESKLVGTAPDKVSRFREGVMSSALESMTTFTLQWRAAMRAVDGEMSKQDG